MFCITLCLPSSGGHAPDLLSSSAFIRHEALTEAKSHPVVGAHLSSVINQQQIQVYIISFNQWLCLLVCLFFNQLAVQTHKMLTTRGPPSPEAVMFSTINKGQELGWKWPHGCTPGVLWVCFDAASVIYLVGSIQAFALEAHDPSGVTFQTNNMGQAVSIRLSAVPCLWWAKQMWQSNCEHCPSVSFQNKNMAAKKKLNLEKVDSRKNNPEMYY